MRWNTLFTLSILGCALIGCATTADKVKLKNSQVFQHPFDRVWRATQIALERYPIQLNNIDSGKIRTAPVELDTVWKSPDAPKKGLRTGFSYKLHIRTVKGKVKGRPAIKVVVLKKLKRHQDFFSGSKNIESDGREESAILYRIQRELDIDRAIETYQEKQNQQGA